MNPGDQDEYGNPVWMPTLHGQNGSAYNVSNEQPDYDVVRALREVVEEVTRGRMHVPQ